jgi:hypothetical protein
MSPRRRCPAPTPIAWSGSPARAPPTRAGIEAETRAFVDVILGALAKDGLVAAAN